MRIAIALLTLTMTACGGGADDAAGADGTSGGEDAVASNQNAPAPAPYVPAIREAPPVTDRAGSSREAPMMACGPADSYRRVAEYRCPDGTVPLGGSPSAGASARVGNVGANSTGHIIDLYRVPCPGGVVEVHVDMYGCPEMQGGLLSDPAPPPDAPARGVGPALRGAATVLLVIVLACLGSVVVTWIRAAVTPDPEPTEVLEVRPTPSVVIAIRDLARLETTSFHVERVIDMTSTQRRLFGLVQAEDSILLVAAADIVAGVDLADVSEDDVVIEGERVVLTVPAPEIFTVALDNERTYVHRRDTDVLAQRSANLETRARREAERTLREAAIEAGIYDRARASAERSLGSLVRSLGYEDVTVRFRDP